ncbi:MAG: hypothetical protein AAB930_00760, partial [Patescibacteria group bacterium]
VTVSDSEGAPEGFSHHSPMLNAGWPPALFPNGQNLLKAKYPAPATTKTVKRAEITIFHFTFSIT